MCGDGANDCGALKTADVGISLSEAEASIAAPFTSAVQNIECVITLLREGRAAMATSFQSFKFIELYALIQFFSVILLIPVGCYLTDHQFLYIDLLALVPLSILQARTAAYPELTEQLPTSTLFYLPVLFSVAGSALIQFGFQCFYFFNVRDKPFWTPSDRIGKFTIGGSKIISYEGSVLFMISNFQYVVTAIAFSSSKPHRLTIFSNKPFFISIIIILAIDIAFVFMPNPGADLATQNTDGQNWLINFFLIEPFTLDGVSYYKYRYFIAGGIVINTAVTLIFEKLLIYKLTQIYDHKQIVRKDEEFRIIMEGQSKSNFIIEH